MDKAEPNWKRILPERGNLARLALTKRPRPRLGTLPMCGGNNAFGHALMTARPAHDLKCGTWRQVLQAHSFFRRAIGHRTNILRGRDSTGSLTPD